MRAALERITHLEAEAAQREAKVQELNEYVVATEAKALRDLEGVREDRSEYEMLAAEARERAIGMRAERNLAFEVAQDAEKKLDVCTTGLAASEGQVTALTKENKGMRDGVDNRAATISGMSQEIVAISLHLEDINNPVGYTLSQGTMLRAFISSFATLPATTRRELDEVVMVDLCGYHGPRNVRNLTAAMESIASATGFRLVKWVPGSSIFAVLVHETGLPEVVVIGWVTGVTVYAAIVIVTSIWLVIARLLAVARHTVPSALGRGLSAARHAMASALQRFVNSVRAVDDLFARGRHRIEAAWNHPVQAADDLFMFLLAVLRVDGRVLSAMFGVMTGTVLVLGWLVVGVGQG
ncbi:unnamed protein product [Sphacelaria rigidula]